MKTALTAAAVLMTATTALAHPGHEHGAEGAMHHVAWLVVPAAIAAAVFAVRVARRRG